MDASPKTPRQMHLEFDIAMLPGVMRAMRLMPAVALASSASPAFRETFRALQQQMLLQSPLPDLDVINESVWFDMVTALSSAKTVSIHRSAIRYSEKFDIAVIIDGLEFVVASEIGKGHSAHDDIAATIRALAPSGARWKNRAGAAQSE